MVRGIVNLIRAFFNLLSGGSGREKTAQKPSDKKVNLTRPFTLAADHDADDTCLRKVLTEDIRGLETPLHLMKKYYDALNSSLGHDDIDDKLDALFRAGKTPAVKECFYHGVTLSLKNGVVPSSMQQKLVEIFGDCAEIDPFQIIYGRLLSKSSPWAGKAFRKLGSEKFAALTGGRKMDETGAYLGINSFLKTSKDTLNNIAGEVLSLVIDMEEVPVKAGKQRSWIYAKGGMFIAGFNPSVNPDSRKGNVLSLNYRFESLGNKLPNNLLVDELVEIADGLFLGKLYYATSISRMIKPYDSTVANDDYKYRGFGYFLLMDDTWLQEKNKLFPELMYELEDDLPVKFTTLTLADENGNEALKADVKKEKSVLHYLQKLSKGVEKGGETEKRYFESLHRLFSGGEVPEGISGCLHGGVVAFKSEGFGLKIGRNILNDLWPSIRPFSPWSGKTFTNTTVETLRNYIGNDAEYYKDTTPLLLGANTYYKDLDISLAVTTFVEKLGAIGMAVEPPTEEEKEQDVHVKSFFFISRNASSVYPPCKGKNILRLNYRWPGLHTMPPDNLCYDELVRIADGLYLGQLLYATEIKKPYNPETDPSEYHYEHFGYFMLMDDDWWSIKEFICFDTEN